MSNEDKNLTLQEIWKREIRDYVKSGMKFKNRKDLYDKIAKLLEEKYKNEETDFAKNRDWEIRMPTFYAYLTSMNFRKMPNGRYDFADEDSVFLDSIITEKDFNRRLYFEVTDPHLGLVIVDLINRNHEFGTNFHCITLQDLLICFYNKSEHSRDAIIDFVKSTLKKYILYNVKRTEQKTEIQKP